MERMILPETGTLRLKWRKNWLLDFLNLDLDKVSGSGLARLFHELALFVDPHYNSAEDLLRGYPSVEAVRTKLKDDQAYLREKLSQAIEAEEEDTFWEIYPVEVIYAKFEGELVKSTRLKSEELGTERFPLLQALEDILDRFWLKRFARCKSPECRRFIYMKNDQNRGYCLACSKKKSNKDYHSARHNRMAMAKQKEYARQGIKKPLKEIREEIQKEKGSKKD